MASLYCLATLCYPERSTAELKHQITVREAACRWLECWEWKEQLPCWLP